MLCRLEPRASASNAMFYAAPFMAMLLTVATGLLLFALLGKDPWTSFQAFFVTPVSTLYGVTELLLKATPLMLCGVGLAVCYRARIWNIGAEGQYVMGAVAATAFALHVGAGNSSASPSYLLLFGTMVAGALGGMAWAAIPALLRTRYNANIILTSLMLVYAAQLIESWLVFGPMQDPKGMNFPQTPTLAACVTLPTIVHGTRLNLAFPFALLLLAAAQLFLSRSYLGYKLRVAGEAQAAARYAGFSASRMVWVAMLVSGACAGIAGMAEVAGPMGQLTDQISVGYGFAAIIVAYVGRLSPPGIFLSSILLALFYLGGYQAQVSLNLPAAISQIFQGLLLFYLLAANVLINHRVRWVSWRGARG